MRSRSLWKACMAAPLALEIELQPRLRPLHLAELALARERDGRGAHVGPAEADIRRVGIRHRHLVQQPAVRAKTVIFPVTRVATQILPEAVTARLSNLEKPGAAPRKRPPCGEGK